MRKSRGPSLNLRRTAVAAASSPRGDIPRRLPGNVSRNVEEVRDGRYRHRFGRPSRYWANGSMAFIFVASLVPDVLVNLKIILAGPGPRVIGAHAKLAASLRIRRVSLRRDQNLDQGASSSGDGGYFKILTARPMHQSQNHEGADRLHSHRQFGPAGRRHHIGRAERRGVGKAEIEVVEEFRVPAWCSYSRIELGGEGEVGELGRSQKARDSGPPPSSTQ